MRGSIALLAFVSLWGCGSDTPPSFDRTLMLRTTGARVIVPGLEALADRCTELESSLTALAAAPDAAAVETARTRWRDAYLAFERTVPYHFGPARDRNLALELAFWPTRTESIEAHIAETSEITDAWISSLGASGEGLFAIEYLLFEPAAASVVAHELTVDPRRPAYLAALGRHAARTAGSLRDAWTGEGGHLEIFASASAPGNLTYRSLLTAESVLLSYLVEALASIRNGRLSQPFGHFHGDVPQPLAVRTRWAHASVAGMLATLDGARALFTADGDGASLEGYVRFRNAELADRSLAQWTAAHAALEAVPEPLDAYVVRAARTEGDAAISAMRELERSVGADVVALLGASLLPVDTDGD